MLSAIFWIFGAARGLGWTIALHMIGAALGMLWLLRRRKLDWGPALGNLAIALAGNFVGGGLLIGWYYAYANDDRKFLRKQLARDA